MSRSEPADGAQPARRRRVERPFFRHARLHIPDGKLTACAFVLYSYAELDAVVVEYDVEDTEPPAFTYYDSAMRETGPRDNWRRYDTLVVSPEYLHSMPANVEWSSHAARGTLVRACRRASIRRIELDVRQDHSEKLLGLLRVLPDVEELQMGSPHPSFLLELSREWPSRFTSLLVDVGVRGHESVAAALHSNRHSLREIFIPDAWDEDAERDRSLVVRLSECSRLGLVHCHMSPYRFIRTVCASKIGSLREVVLDVGDFDGEGDEITGWIHELHRQKPDLQAITLVAPAVGWSELPGLARAAAKFTELRKFVLFIGDSDRDGCPPVTAREAFDALRNLVHLETLGIGDVPGLEEFVRDKRSVINLCVEASVVRRMPDEVRLAIIQRRGRIWLVDREQEMPDPDTEREVLERPPKTMDIAKFLPEGPLSDVVAAYATELPYRHGSIPDRYGDRSRPLTPVTPNSLGDG